MFDILQSLMVTEDFKLRSEFVLLFAYNYFYATGSKDPTHCTCAYARASLVSSSNPVTLHLFSSAGFVVHAFGAYGESCELGQRCGCSVFKGTLHFF